MAESMDQEKTNTITTPPAEAPSTETAPPAAAPSITAPPSAKWLGKQVADELEANTTGILTIAMRVIYGTRFTDKGDVEATLSENSGKLREMLSDYDSRVAAGGLLREAQYTGSTNVVGANGTMHKVTTLSGGKDLVNAMIKLGRHEFLVLGVEPEDSWAQWYPYKVLREALSKEDGVINIEQASTADQRRFGMVLRGLPVTTVANMIDPVTALAAAMRITPVGIRPKQERGDDGEFISKAYTGAAEVYFAGATPTALPFMVPYRSVINGEDENMALVLKDGQMNVMNSVICRGCGAVLSETGGKHKLDEGGNECGQLARAQREAAMERRRAEAANRPSAETKRAYIAKVPARRRSHVGTRRRP
ncbi:MAG: hypothetical protein ACKVI4_17935, partial [Actinomycetales bacterium]